jgi:hypothetical protein
MKEKAVDKPIHNQQKRDVLSTRTYKTTNTDKTIRKLGWIQNRTTYKDSNQLQ